jgi:hypothetical protein
MGSGGSGNDQGMINYCYTTGYMQAQPTVNVDTVNEAVEIIPCTLHENYNKAYAQGHTDAMNNNKK